MKITSLQNEQVKYWVKLRNKSFRDKERVFLVEGDHLVSEAIASGKVKYIISSIDTAADYFVTKEIMKKISNQKSIPNICAVVQYLDEVEPSGNLLILDGIQDPGNLGTIIRSACAFNFNSIILGTNCVDMYNHKVISATEGMIFNVNILRKKLVNYIPSIKNKYIIIGTDVVNGSSIKSIDKSSNIAIVIGSEGRGISDDVKSLCDKFVHINMSSSVESLNASICASILMYEVYNG